MGKNISVFVRREGLRIFTVKMQHLKNREARDEKLKKIFFTFLFVFQLTL